MRLFVDHAAYYLRDTLGVIEAHKAGWKCAILALPAHAPSLAQQLAMRHLAYQLESQEGSLFYIDPDNIVLLFHGKAGTVLKVVRAVLEAYELDSAAVEAFDVSTGWQKLLTHCVAASLNSAMMQ